MGGSYRSSSSSSSGYRSSSSSSTRSSSTWSSTRSSSTSGYSSNHSGPEATAYFSTSQEEIYIHFRADGSAHIIENYIILPNSASVGIVRNKYTILEDWKVENLTVSPEYFPGAYNHQYAISWTKGENEKSLDLEIEYDIENAVSMLGTFPIVFWSIKRNSIVSKNGNFELTWDPALHWKDLRVEQKVYDQSISSYVNLPIASKNDINSIKLDFLSLKEDFKEFVITGFPIEIPPRLASLNPYVPLTNKYEVIQKTFIQKNCSNTHTGSIQLASEQNTSISFPGIEFNYTYFLGVNPSSAFAFLSPSYQITYNLSDNLQTSFWNLHGAKFKGEPTPVKIDNIDFLSQPFEYSKLGEQYTSADRKKQIIVFTPAGVRLDNGVISGLKLEVILPDEINMNDAKVKLFISNCSYCSRPTPTLEIPAEINTEDHKIFIHWNNPIPKDYFPIVHVETDASQYSSNFAYTYVAALRALFLAPGAGTNAGYLLINTLFIIIPVLIGFVLYRRKTNQGKAAEDLSKSVEKLKQYDPSFELNSFLIKSKTIAEKIVNAWTLGDMESARHFISAGVFQRFQIQLKLLNEIDGIKNLMSDFKVIDQSILFVTTSPDYLTIHLKISCSARDLSVPINTPKEEYPNLLRKTSNKSYEEIYSFSRKILAQTEAGKDLFHNQCPSCGADSPFSHSTNKCQFCGSIFNSGESEWVLSEITQTSEWNLHSNSAEKSSTDSDISSPTSIQILEDRASALLWKWIYAKCKGDARYLSRETSSHKLLAETQKKETIFIPVIGSADLHSLEKDGSGFTAEIGIKWSFANQAQSLPQNRLTKMKIRLLSSRDDKLGFGEASCKNCGAPYPEIDATNCAYCSEAIPETVADWLLEELN
jgi:hypothetical protein